MADPTLPDVKKLLDDPGVSDDVKRDLVTAFVSSDPRSAFDLQSHADRLGMPGLFLPALGTDVRPWPGLLEDAVHKAEQQRNKRESDEGRQALGDGRTGVANSNSILDQGAPGLRYFEYFAPLYQRCISGSEVTRDKACELYDEQRDIDFAALRADGDTVTKAARKLSSEIVDQRNSWNSIDQIWTGQGAEAANARVDGYLRQAAAARSQVEKFGAVLNPAADALEKAVQDKARFVAGLYADTIDGKSAEQISEIIYYAQNGHNSLTAMPETYRVLQMFGASVTPGFLDFLKIATPILGGPPAYLGDLIEKAEKHARDFVDKVFVPDVEGKWRALVRACTAGDTSVREIYKKIVAEVNTINDHPFTALTSGLPPIPDQAQQPQEKPHTSTGMTPSPGPSAGVQLQQSPVPGVQSQPGPSAGMSVPQAYAPPVHDATAGATPGISAAPTVPRIAAGKGVAWVRDPSQLPQGWRIDPATGELSPPPPPHLPPPLATVGAATVSPATTAVPAGIGGGSVEVHSSAARELLDHDGLGDLRDTERHEHSGLPGDSASAGPADASTADAAASTSHGGDQVRTASAVGWSDGSDAAGQGGTPSLAHADSATGAAVSSTGVGTSDGGVGLGALWGDQGGSLAVGRSTDQWLLLGDDGGEESWDSLQSVVATDTSHFAPSESTPAGFGNPEETGR